MSFDLYMMGGEQKGWRELLLAGGARNVGISYWSWRKRMSKRTKPDIASFGFDSVLLDSGGYSANSKPEQLSQKGWREYADEYFEFVLDHIDDITLVTEFDCHALGQPWIDEQRRTVWSQIDPQKFLPVWHPQMGLPALEELGDNYPRVAIHESAVTGGGLNVTPHLNSLARRGVKLHGTAMTKPTILKQVAFETAASTSWLSCGRYGDTQVWVNNQLTRYPVKMKQQARQRHTALFDEHGFDVEKILADDATEVTKVALWSWLQQEKAIQAMRLDEPDRSNYAHSRGTEPNVSTELVLVDTPEGDVGNAEMPREPLQQRAEDEIRHLPMFGTREVQSMNTETREVETIELLEVRGTSSRRCDTCVLAKKCDEFKPNTTCAYSIPVAIKTPEQRKALITGMIEMQAQRVQFGYLVEQMNGGYPDPNLSQEYDRLMKAMQTQADLEDNRDFLKISVEAKGKTGVLSRIFGSAPTQQLDAGETDTVATRILEGQRVT